MSCRYAQQIYHKEKLEKEDYVNKFYIINKYRATYLDSLPLILPDNLFNNIICKASPRQKALDRLKKMRERRKEPIIGFYYSIYYQEDYNRYLFIHHPPAENKIKPNTNLSSSDDDLSEFKEIQKVELEEKARLIL